MNRWFRIACALTAGVLLAQGANGHGWWLTVVGLAILIRLIQHRNRWERVLVAGVATSVWFGIHVSWIRVLGIDTWLLLTLLCVIPWLLLSLVSLPTRGWRQYFVTSAGVVLVEWLHDNVPWGGFPWGNLGYSQLDGPLVGLSLWGGQSLVAVAVVCSAIACVQLMGQGKLARGLVVTGLLFICSMMAFPSSIYDDVRTTDVAVIQGGPELTSHSQHQQWAVFHSHIKQTDRLSVAVKQGKFTKPSLIVWPENSTDVDPLNNAGAYKEISDLVNRVQVPILIGGVTWQSNPYGPRNAGILWMPKVGPTQIYVKNHLVPFGEYIPLRNVVASRVGRLNQIPDDFVPGKEPGVFDLDGRKFGDVVCFEIAYEDHLTRLVRNGARFITLQTNNATYLGTDQSKQQFAIARFRAIEHRRSIAMASTTGISGLISWNGRVEVASQQGQSTFLSTEIQTLRNRTFTDRHPHWVVLLSAVIMITFAAGQIGKKRRVISISSRSNG